MSSLRRLRVAYLLPAFDVGGAERAVLRTARRMDPARHETVIAGFVRGTGRLLEQAEAKGIRTTVISTERGFGAWRLVPGLFRWLRSFRPDVLLTFMFHANLAGRIVGRLAGVAVIVSSERVVGWESRTRILLNRLTVRFADAVTTNSESGRAFWQTKLGRDVHVVYNGVDTEEFVPAVSRLSSSKLRIGVLARLHRANGHAWFLEALARLAARKATGWQCVLCGEGPEAASLQALALELGLRDLAVFNGHCDDARRFLQSLDVYAHPALVAGMPNAVLEAMACGLPVVATAVGGTSEAVANGETGWVVPVGDVERMAGFLHRLLDDAAVRHRMGERGRARAVARFSIDAAAAQLEALIESLVARNVGLRFEPALGWIPIEATSQEEDR